MRSSILLPAAIAGLLIVPAFARADPQSQSQPAQSQPEGEAAAEERKEPEHIKVQHILISFVGRLRGNTVTRSAEEAKDLAYQLYERALAEEDFEALIEEFSDDPGEGVYSMANHGVRPGPGEYQRSGMVPAFGDVGFPMEIGEIGIADFDGRKSPHGWHIVKRIE